MSSRGIRVADSEEKGHINNFAATVRYEIPHVNDATLALRGGYVRSLRFASLIDVTIVIDRNVILNSFALGLVLAI